MSLDTGHSIIIKYLSMSMGETIFGIDSLPPELLPKIFKYLNIHDRKNVRLTCRLWNNICNLEEIIKHEKFVFHPGKEGCDLLELGAHIEESKALRSCWEFQGLPLHELPLTVWANCGDQVQSLFIYGCEVDDETISNIIIHCINVKTLRLQSVLTWPDDWDRPIKANEDLDMQFDFDGLFCTERGIDELIQCNIKRLNLTSLILHTPEVLSTRKLRKLFQIFPCIQTFGHGPFLASSYNYENNTATEWVFPPTMEVFVSHVTDDILNSLKRSDSKLKVLSAMLNYDYTPYDAFLNLCSEQKELEKLALDVNATNCDHDDEDILFLILRSLPKLKELEFNASYYSNSWSCSSERVNEFLVLTSKLESMQLDYAFDYSKHFSWHVFPPSLSAEYSVLKSLTLSEINPNFTYEILRRCRTSLHHLSVTTRPVNDEILQLILRVHTEVKTLHISLVGLYESNEDGSVLEGKKYPFAKLTNLEYLRICSIDTDILRNTVSEFIFPKLTYFEFDCSSCWQNSSHVPPPDDAIQNLGTMLRIVCQGAPYLETLKVGTSVFKSIDFVNHFRNVQMKYLRYITIHSLASNLMSEGVFPTLRRSDSHFGSIDAVFNACPSLCLITFGRDDCCTYSYNRHSKEVKRHSYFNKFDPIRYKNILSL